MWFILTSFLLGLQTNNLFLKKHFGSALEFFGKRRFANCGVEEECIDSIFLLERAANSFFADCLPVENMSWAIPYIKWKL